MTGSSIAIINGKLTQNGDILCDIKDIDYAIAVYDENGGLISITLILKNGTCIIIKPATQADIETLQNSGVPIFDARPRPPIAPQKSSGSGKKMK